MERRGGRGATFFAANFTIVPEEKAGENKLKTFFCRGGDWRGKKSIFLKNFKIRPENKIGH